MPRPAAPALTCCLALAWSIGHTAETIQVTGAWARATAPSQDVGVVYLSLTSRQGDVLIGASSQDAAGAMLHQSVSQGGMGSMSAIDTLALPPGRTVRLEPKGRHVMLMGLKHPLLAGGHVRLDLVFQHAGTVETDVPILPIGSSGPAARP